MRLFSRDGESGKPKRRFGVTALALCGFAAAALWFFCARFLTVPPGGWEGGRLATVHIIDVGQGSAALIQTAGGAALIDCGDGDHAEALCDYLHEQGVRRLTYLVLSHGHSDHTGGAASVLESCPVDAVLATGETLAGEEDFFTQRLRRALAQRPDCRVLAPTAGLSLPLGEGVSLTVLGVGVDSGNHNDQSLVLRLTAGECGFLFPGDAEAPAELALLQALAPAQLASELLVAGHHGSATSSTEPFLRAVRPAASAVSCGRDNSYGHPHAAVLKRLGEYGPIFRTDALGSLVFFTDGRRLVRQTPTGIELLAG